jgi:ABC-type multidrug transport system ATPase subunit
VSALVLDGVDKRLGRRVVLAGASLIFDGPGVLALRGENGAGKSTLLRLVAGVIQTDAGRIRIDDKDLDRDRVSALAALGYVPEAAELPPLLTVRELTALVVSLKRCAPAGDALALRLGADAILDRPLGALSLGQRRRALLLAALVGDPALLALDEPSNGLDVEGVRMLIDLLKERSERGRAAIVATHDAAFADAIATERAELVGGKVVR